MADPLDLVDADGRRAIAGELGATLFVEAGAGTGKTHELVARVVALVTSDPPLPMRHIAAITFTEKAAAELRDRIRQTLQHEAAAGDSGRADRCMGALAELDAAAVCTLHAFAQRLLRTHPIEAGLPPGVEVLDEVGSMVEFEDRWRRFVDRLLDDPAWQRSLLLARTAGVSLDDLREIAAELDANWDLVEHLPERGATEPAPLRADRLVARLEAMADPPAGVDGSDKMIERLGEAQRYASRLRQAADEADLLWLLARAGPKLTGQIGNKANWSGCEEALDTLRHELAAWSEQRDRVVAEVTDGAVRHVAGALADFTVTAAEDRARSGRLTFHDLLVLARRVLRHPDHGPAVRRSLRLRYQRILIDEFQDTDPIQVDLAVLLASGADDAGHTAWDEVELEPGRLFFVGDPKQSIYRFRRADIATFLRAEETLADRTVHLNQNFRSTGPVIDWVNTVFGRLIRPDPGRQPGFVPLAAARAPAPSGPAVTVLGQRPHDDEPTAEVLRQREAAEVVSTVQWALAEGWAVQDPDSGQWRPARPGDVTILLPSRTSLPELERELERGGVVARVDSSALVYTTREVRDLLAVARAVDDPTDELALVTALRSPAFGCGDDDLYRYRVVHGGHWNHQAPVPEGLAEDDPVAAGLSYLGRLYRQRWWLTPSAVLDRIVADRRLFELGVESGRPRDVLRRLRFVVDQARAYGESVGGSLREYLAWARLQGDERARVAETILPETDADAVRIMTIHAAKGLEFPICVMSGLTTRPGGRKGRVQVALTAGRELHLKVGRDYESRYYEEHREVEETMGQAERIRLLYVAATRARDHLVVSLHRTARQEAHADEARQTAAVLLAGAGAQQGATVAGASIPAVGIPATGSAGLGGDRPPFEEWSLLNEARLAAGRRAGTVAATTLATTAAALDAATPDPHGDPGPEPDPHGHPGPAPDPHGDPGPDGDPGLAKLERNLELPPWARGRYGTAMGRAVHGVLQVVDLATGADVDALARAQSAAEGVPDHHGRVAALARSGLGSQAARAAAAGRHWREVYVAAPVGDTLLEGYIDLLFEDGPGLVVVDFKTDVVAGEGDVAAKLERYRLQGAAYAVALERSVARPVTRVVFVFCRPGAPAVERDLVDLDQARQAVVDRLPAVAAAPVVQQELN